MDPWLENFARANFQRSADTAHDLKTPLNVAVLNLELLRMRLRKLGRRAMTRRSPPTRGRSRRSCAGSGASSTRSSSSPRRRRTTRRPAASTSRRSAPRPHRRRCCDRDGRQRLVIGHEARIRQAYKLFFEGASKVLGRTASARGRSTTTQLHRRRVTGTPAAPDFEPTQIFKFYYTDAAGEPGSLARGCAAHRRDLWW